MGAASLAVQSQLSIWNCSARLPKTPTGAYAATDPEAAFVSTHDDLIARDLELTPPRCDDATSFPDAFPYQSAAASPELRPVSPGWSAPGAA
jgi:hypothetical protein